MSQPGLIITIFHNYYVLLMITDYSKNYTILIIVKDNITVNRQSSKSSIPTWNQLKGPDFQGIRVNLCAEVLPWDLKYIRNCLD